MHIQADKALIVAGYSYLGCLLGTLWWYGTRRSKTARYILALLIFLPALLCIGLGLRMLGASKAGAHHTADAVSDPSGLVTVIGIGICVLGMIIAFFAVRVVARPLKPRTKEKT